MAGRTARGVAARGGRPSTRRHQHAANGHFMGTARMGTDPTTSVVDPFGMAHDIPNLAIVDGSVFVTAGSANPTSTIVALALRTADHLVEHRASYPTPERPHVVQPRRTGRHRPRHPRRRRLQWLRLRWVWAPARHSTTSRERLAAMADVLIPAGATSDRRMPSARRAGRRRRDARPCPGVTPRPRTRAGTGAGRPRSPRARSIPTPGSTLWTARSACPSASPSRRLLLHPEVRDRIGYPGQLARPVNALDYPEYLTEGLLDTVIERFTGRGSPR